MSACSATQTSGDGETHASAGDSYISVFAELDVRPSGIATWDGRVFVSVPRTNISDSTVYELIDAELLPYPNREMQDDIGDSSEIVSVNGLRVDDMGRLWMVDNAVVAMLQPHPEAAKVVVWDVERGEEAFRRSFGPDSFGLESFEPGADASSNPEGEVGEVVRGVEAAAGNDRASEPVETNWIAPGFLNDVAIDEEQGVAYFSDSGIFSSPGIVVYDFVSDQVLRRLDECSVLEADGAMSLTLDGGVVEIGPPSERGPWRVGANPIAMSPGGELLTGAMTSTVLYEVPTESLRNAELESSVACEEATPWATRSITDGITADDDGETLWVTNVQESRVDGYRDGEIVDSYQLPAGSFPISVTEYGDDLLVVTNQLHRSAVFHGGVEKGEPPYVIYRIER